MNQLSLLHRDGLDDVLNLQMCDIVRVLLEMCKSGMRRITSAASGAKMCNRNYRPPCLSEMNVVFVRCLFL